MYQKAFKNKIILTKFYESDNILPNLSGDTMFKIKHKLNMYTKRLLG